MEFAEIKNIIETAQNITLLPSPELEKDTFPASLAFFYGLKKLGKNVNFLCENLPEKFNFLIKKDIPIPLIKSFDCLMSSRNFLISIKESETKLSQIFYQKTEEELNLYLKTDRDGLKKEDISFGPLDLECFLFCFGVKNFRQIKDIFKEEKWNSIINIDNENDNENYGEINLIQPYCSFSEIVFDILETLDQKLFDDTDVLNSLLTGIAQENSNSRDNNPDNSKIFQKINFLMEKGANWQEIIFSPRELENNSCSRLFKKILNKLTFSYEKNISWLILQEQDFKESGASPTDLAFSFKKLIFSNFPFQNLLCLWPDWGIFYSFQKQISEKVQSHFQGEKKGNGILFKTVLDAQKVKDEILNLL